MLRMLKQALEFIDSHPRIILLMAWPVFTAVVVGLILIIWKGPWIITAALQMKQLDILGGIAMGIIAIIALNQLAQSSTFFGRLGLKLGSVFDLNADMDGDSERNSRTQQVASDATEGGEPPKEQV